MGELDFHLARDMGKTLIPPYVAVTQILGDGEVEDGPPPLKRCKLSQYLKTVKANTLHAIKGKEKIYAHFSFNDAGALHPKAVKLIDDGKLVRFSGEFSKQVINLDAEVGNGVFARDVLHHAMLGTMHAIIPKLHVPKKLVNLEDFKGLMSVEEVLELTGFAPSSAFPQTSADDGIA